MCRFCPPDPDEWVLPPLHVAPCNCRLHRDDLVTNHVWVGDVKIDADTGEVLSRVLPVRGYGQDHSLHVSDRLLSEGRIALGRPDMTLPVPF